jgi:hypothetical protein
MKYRLWPAGQAVFDKHQEKQFDHYVTGYIYSGIIMSQTARTKISKIDFRGLANALQPIELLK